MRWNLIGVEHDCEWFYSKPSLLDDQAWDVKHLTQMVRRAVRKKAQIAALQRGDHINVYLPCTFFMLHLPRCKLSHHS